MKVSYPYNCAEKSDIPDDAIEHLDEELIDKLGGNFSLLFPRFSEFFSESTRIIDENWDKPTLVLEKGVRNWLKYILVQSKTKNIFFSLKPKFIEKEGEFFDEDHEMLPDGWKEIYRWFNAFCITDLDYSPSEWWNTPFRYESRLDLDDYEKGSGATRKETDEFSKKIGCDRRYLKCWLLTEVGDALFINESSCDQKVYHVKGSFLNDFIELKDPVKKLDSYLSHLLNEFPLVDFRWRD
ncbi:MAG: hypothetical protein HWE18_06765 [Gammaproteobacteria bacterium]|nr:hypothetical protein [Gammaproteobacteria bacterium]